MKKILAHATSGFAALALTLALVGCGVSANSNNKQVTNYGIVDWSTANKGYIVFTAEGEEYRFILQGPNSAQTLLTAQDGETIQVSLTDGTGRYQYAIAKDNTDHRSCRILYKSSFIYQ